MSWYNGIKKMNYEEFINSKIKIAENLYFDEDEKYLCLINDIKKDSPLYSLSDPKMEIEDPKQVFYNFIFDSDQNKVKEFINELDIIENEEDIPKISLFRKENDEFLWYSYGRVVTHLLNEQENLKSLLPDMVNKDNIFIVPLNKYYFKCPVCFNRTLQTRYDWNICPECGFEDEGIPMGANGYIIPSKEILEKYPSVYEEYVDFYKLEHNIPYEEKIIPDLENIDEEILLTMIPDVYRDEYLKLKKENHDYSWAKDVGLIDDEKK